VNTVKVARFEYPVQHVLPFASRGRGFEALPMRSGYSALISLIHEKAEQQKTVAHLVNGSPFCDVLARGIGPHSICF